MYQLSAVPVEEHCMKAMRRACQTLYSCSDVGCKPKENVTRASIYCKYSSGVLLWSSPSKGLMGSDMEVEELIYVGCDIVL